MVLLVLFAAVAGAAIPIDDKDFRTGLKSYNSKNYKAAVKYFREYINKKPDPTAYYLIGYSLYKLGRFSEADEYFRDAYLIDPEYSLEKVGLVKKASGEVVAMAPGSAKKPEPAAEKKEAKPAPAAEAKPGQPVKQPEQAAKAQPPAKEIQTKPAQVAPADQKAKAPETSPALAQKPAAPVPQQAQPANPPQAVPTPTAPTVSPMPMQLPNAAGPAALVGIIAAFGMILVFIGIAFYVYYSLCLFLIAKKLDVPAPWTAWIPIVQVWTFVASAGKPGWWILLLLVPIVNFFIGMYLWMCITENLGKNKWLALLILVPLVNIAFPAWLAFSKTESAGGYTPPDDEPLTE